MDKEPEFIKLAYSHSGVYECEVEMGPLSQKVSFELVVEGKGLKEILSCSELLDRIYTSLVYEWPVSLQPEDSLFILRLETEEKIKQENQRMKKLVVKRNHCRIHSNSKNVVLQSFSLQMQHINC